ncbi:hypothetical protein C8Q74DRAFT_1006657 [Fomes fomentarius]|nr:hypothetical protein C8Q74DRAFT_1006657 [Fomes fomentarius]
MPDLQCSYRLSQDDVRTYARTLSCGRLLRWSNHRQSVTPNQVSVAFRIRATSCGSTQRARATCTSTSYLATTSVFMRHTIGLTSSENASSSSMTSPGCLSRRYICAKGDVVIPYHGVHMAMRHDNTGSSKRWGVVSHVFSPYVRSLFHLCAQRNWSMSDVMGQLIYQLSPHVAASLQSYPIISVVPCLVKVILLLVGRGEHPVHCSSLSQAKHCGRDMSRRCMP